MAEPEWYERLAADAEVEREQRRAAGAVETRHEDWPKAPHDRRQDTAAPGGHPE